jgi:hypothetical protein
MAASLKNEKFFSLPSTPNQKTLGDDYTHKTMETCKFKAATTKGGSFNYKGTIAMTEAESGRTFKIGDEVKFGFPYKTIYY